MMASTAGLFVLFFVYLFTRPLPGVEVHLPPPGEHRATHAADLERREAECQEFARLKQYWMFMAYSFMVLALFLAVYPFTIDLRLDADEDGYIEQVHRTLDSPIGIFRGCTIDPGARGKPLHCNGNGNESDRPGSAGTPQLSWVLQIGGNVTPFGPGIPGDEADRELEGSIAAAKRDLDQAIAERKRRSNALDDLRQKLANAVPDDKPAIQKEIALAEASLREQDTEANKARLALLWVAGERASFVRGDSGFYVSGGLIIPFYLIVLSLVGGAVSLTRRIPEYQKQAAPGYVGIENAPALTPPMLREYLVFQIVQFISAPFIAAVAYYVLLPSTTSATVGLAFAAGFASETVLLWVRAAVEKVRPAAEPDTPTGSVAGTIPKLKDKSAGDLEQQTNIEIIGHANLVTVFSDNGQFAIDDVPEGARALQVVYNPGGSATRQVWCRRVDVQADKTVPVLVELGP